ncbi:hypothetical protein PR003_g6424 [Phytophthora rubi]|uniref:Uncharacterized protein n=1 Tax=Phytophthora rubi TaxID=129364 RepID=A0A6A4FQJ9_9STRA|nr:hypothetical protein PR003_g6424 [Phytophthora rubi]
MLVQAGLEVQARYLLGREGGVAWRRRPSQGTVKLVSSCNPRKSSCQEAGWYSGGEVGVGVRATEAKLMRSRWYSGGEVGVGVQAKEAKLPRSRDGAVGVVV